MNIRNIRNYLANNRGCNIIIYYYGSRNRKEVYHGILDKTYFNVFTIILTNGETRSFNYTDVLTKTIKIYI